MECSHQGKLSDVGHTPAAERWCAAEEYWMTRRVDHVALLGLEWDRYMRMLVFRLQVSGSPLRRCDGGACMKVNREELLQAFDVECGAHQERGIHFLVSARLDWRAVPPKSKQAQRTEPNHILVKIPCLDAKNEVNLVRILLGWFCANLHLQHTSDRGCC